MAGNLLPCLLRHAADNACQAHIRHRTPTMHCQPRSRRADQHAKRKGATGTAPYHSAPVRFESPTWLLRGIGALPGRLHLADGMLTCTVTDSGSAWDWQLRKLDALTGLHP